MFCGNCGAELDTNPKFCGTCGSQVNQRPQVKPDIFSGLKRWHWGKIAILWLATPVLMVVGLALLIDQTELSDGWCFGLSLLLPPTVMSGVTWVWLSGKQKPSKDRETS
jgi:hypothetical protein